MRKNTNIIEKRFKDGTIVFNGEKIFLFKGISQILWDFVGSIPQEEMTKIISETFGISEELVRKDVEDFFEKLLKENLIIKESEAKE
jgi:hypothetical protein